MAGRVAPPWNHPGEVRVPADEALGRVEWTPVTAQDWDHRYAEAARERATVWSPGPNRLVDELLADQSPGTAIDLGAGEGRHALWLAGRGWTVTAVDFSSVGLDQGRALVENGPGRVEWVVADVTDWAPDGPVDLVLVAYLHLPSESLVELLRRLPGWVAPGGTLLVLGHDRDNLERGIGGPPNPDVLYAPALLEDVVRGSDLEVDRCEQVLRPVEKGGQRADAIDTLLLAHRVPGA